MDALGNRMKMYESIGQIQLMPLLPVVARLDGKAFHNFTKGLHRPFDDNFIKLMVNTTKYLVEETNALIGYTQSDEITLIWYSDNIKSQIFMGGRHFKMIAILSAMTTAFFQKKLKYFLPDKSEQNPLFDCRVWNVPNKTEAINTLIWREQDAVRNSISMLAQSKFSHNELYKKTTDDMQEMLFQKHQINWNDLPNDKKRGTYIRRKKIISPFTCEEIEKLPLKHDARKNPSLVVERNIIEILDMPILTKILNREEVIFNGDEPLIYDGYVDPS